MKLTVRPVPLRIDHAGLLACALALAAAPGNPTAIALGLLVALLLVAALDGRRPLPRFTRRRRLLCTARYRSWRAWDTERDRWCVLVGTVDDRPGPGAAALAEARRVLAVGPAYDTARDAEGPLWVFEGHA